MSDPDPQPSASEPHAAFARRVLDAEAAAIGQIPLDADFDRAVALVTEAGRRGGSVVVSGLGKSGLVGAKLSATLASTGTPSHFLHPVEAMHGDLGRVRRGDVVLLLSYTGNTEEVVTLAELLRADGVPLIALAGKAGGALGRAADALLSVGDVTEACPLALAPTSSSTAMLALGDALALSVSRARAFTADDFQKFHPGGGLGRQLTPVVEAMRFHARDHANGPANLPLIRPGTAVKDAYAAAERFAKDSGLRRPGALLVADADAPLAGIVTDGDLRTALIRTGPRVWAGPIDGVMTAGPTTLPDTAVVRDAVHVVRTKRFDEIPVVDGEGRPVGLIDVQDLAALKVIEG